MAGVHPSSSTPPLPAHGVIPHLPKKVLKNPAHTVANLLVLILEKWTFNCTHNFECKALM